jgi:uncharacterized membrane protein YuzA (DUF378 family)
MKVLHLVAYVLLFAGGLNWGLVGLFDFNLVESLLATIPMVEKVVYVLVGAATVYIVATHMSYCRVCNPSGK